MHFYSYEMIKSTWQEEPEKRPSFADTVQFFHHLSIEVSDEPVIDAENDGGYLDVSQEQTTLHD